MKRYLFACGLLVFAASTMRAQGAPNDTAIVVSFGAFVDSYYAYDVGETRSIDRAFTTQAARHNEFNVNLAHIEAKLSGERVRGRLALQAGTSVQSNYSGEPAIGGISGPALSRTLQEAVAGYRVTPSIWIDGGIFFSHIGMESFISRDNLTYTRSLSAEYTPYYESGAKITWQVTPRVTGTLVAMNGWQNISESNDHKAAGVRVDFAASGVTSLSYYNFLGRETASGLGRVFNGVGVKTVRDRVTVQANADFGIQETDDAEQSEWYSAGVIAKLQLRPQAGVSARAEIFRDPDQVVISTGTADGFEGTTASLGMDILPLRSSRFMWRSEMRGTWTSKAAFPRRSSAELADHNYLVATSLALTF